MQTNLFIGTNKQDVVAPEQRSWAAFAIPGLAAIVALSFVLRVIGLSDLSLQGDYAYSVYAARQDLVTIALQRVIDGHPPLYYYLLHFWMLIFGQSEFSVRMLSALFGVLMVPVTYVFVACRLDRKTALLAALLVAVSPMLVHYSRMPRMYILLALLALVSAHALASALERDRYRDWFVFILFTVLLLYTHYYGLLVVGVEGIFLFCFYRNPRQRLLRGIVALVIAVITLLPWLLFAALSAAKATAGIISNAPWPDSVWGLLEQVWITFNLGDYLDIVLARPLALLILTVLAVLLVVGRKALRQQRQGLMLPIFASVLPVAAFVLVFLFVPYAARPRFLIFCVPFFLVLFAAVLSSNRAWLTIAGMAIAVAASGYSLIALYQTEPYVVEQDAVQLTEYIGQVARPQEAVIFHAFWEIGYFTTHYVGEAPTKFNLNDLPMEDVETILAPYPRVWLAMYKTRERDPAYPLEEWLDRHWHKTDQVEFGPTRLVSYVPPSTRGWDNADFVFEAGDERPILGLSATQQSVTRVKPGESVAVGLKWHALVPVSGRYTVFVHLVDSTGQGWAGTDREPLGGSEPTAGWPAGKDVEDRTAFVVPPLTPPGDYTILVGLYPTGNPQPMRAKAQDGSVQAKGIAIGHVQVDSLAVQDLRARHQEQQTFGKAVALKGYDLDIDFYQTERTSVLTALTDNPINLTFPKRAYKPSDEMDITLYWEALQSMDQDYTVFIHLVDRKGQVVGQVDGLPGMGKYPTSCWQVGNMIVDKHRLKIDSLAPPGEYHLLVGMYLLSTMERLPAQGNASGVFELQSVTID